MDGGETCAKPDCIKVTPVLFGDANEDNRTNQADTLLVLQEKPAAGTNRFRKSDVHTNGAIEVGDALFTAQYNVGLRDVWFGAL